MDDRLKRVVGSILGTAAIGSREVVGRGYSQNRRYLVTLADDRTVFVKAAVDPRSAAWLRTEHLVYTQVEASFLPRLLGWDDNGENPVMVLEDLSDADWPPPWTPDRVHKVLGSLTQVAAASPPPELPSLESKLPGLAGWSHVAEDPEPFLRLRVCSRTWLEAALPLLLPAAEGADVSGDALVHLDVRSDNICFRDGQAMLIDWNHACIGNPAMDLASWLPSLRAEEGPPPEDVMPGVQRAQLETALPWAARSLGLSEPLAGMRGT